MPAGWGGESDIIDQAIERHRQEEEQRQAEEALAQQRAQERQSEQDYWNSQQQRTPNWAVPDARPQQQVGLAGSPVNTGTPQIGAGDPYASTVQLEQEHIDRHPEQQPAGSPTWGYMLPGNEQRTTSLPLAGSQRQEVQRSSFIPQLNLNLPETGNYYLDQTLQTLGMQNVPQQEEQKPEWMKWVEDNFTTPLTQDIASYASPQGQAQHQTNMQANIAGARDWWQNNPNIMYANDQWNKALGNVSNPESYESKQAQGWMNVGKVLAATRTIGLEQVGQIMEWANSQPVRTTGVNLLQGMNYGVNAGMIPATTPINQWLLNKNEAGGLDWFPQAKYGSSVYDLPPSPSIAEPWVAVGKALNQGFNPLNPNFNWDMWTDPEKNAANTAKMAAGMVPGGLKYPIQTNMTPVDTSTIWGKILSGAEWMALNATQEYTNLREAMQTITDMSQVDPQVAMMKRDVWSGSSRMMNAANTAYNKQATIDEMAATYQQQALSGDADGAALTYKQMMDLKDKSYGDILGDNMNVWAELLSAAYGDVSPLGWGGHIIGHSVGEFTKIFNLEKFKGVYDIGKDAANANLDLALMRGGDFIKDVAGTSKPGSIFTGSGIADAWAKSVAPYLSRAEKVTQSPFAAGGIFALDAKAKAIGDANILLRNIKWIFKDTISTKGDARVILDSLIRNPKSLIEGIMGLTSEAITKLSPEGFMQWGPGVVGNKELTRRFPLLTMAQDMIRGMDALKGEGMLEGEKFFAEMAGILYDTSRTLNGVRTEGKLPFNAAAVKLIEGAEGLGRYAYQNAKGKNLFLSDVMPIEEARRFVEGIGAGGFEQTLKNIGKVVSIPLDIQKRLMSDMWLFYRPANWLRNAVSGSAMLTANDMYGSARQADMIDWFVKKLGVVDPLTGVADITSKSQTGPGLIAPILKRVLGDNWAGRFVTGLAEKMPNIAYGNSYVPLTNIPVGETAMKTQGFFRRSVDNVTSLWSRKTNELYQGFTGLGVSPDVSKPFLEGLKWIGINGSKEDVIAYANKFAETGRFMLTPESFNLPTDILSSKGYSELSRVLSSYGPEQWQQAQRELQTMFSAELAQPLEWLRSTPKQTGDFNWMKHDIPNQAQMINDLSRRYLLRAGEEIGSAGTRAAQTADQFLAAHADQWNNFREALRAAPNTPNSWAVAGDYYSEYTRITRAANSQVDQLTRDAAVLQNWGPHADSVRSIYDQAAKDVASLGRKYVTALEQVKGGQAYKPVTSGWLQALEDYHNFDNEWFNSLKNYQVKGVQDPKYAQKVAAYRSFVETKVAGMMEAFRMFPSMDNFDIVAQTTNELGIIGRSAAEKMAEAKKALGEGRLSVAAFRNISDSTWEQAWGYMGAHAEATGRAMTAHALATNTSDTLRFKAADKEYFLYGPKNGQGLWDAVRIDNGSVKTFAGPAAAGTPPNPNKLPVLPQGIVDEYYRLTQGRAAAIPTVQDANVAAGAQAVPITAGIPDPRVIVPPQVTRASVQAVGDEGRAAIAKGDAVVAGLTGAKDTTGLSGMGSGLAKGMGDSLRSTLRQSVEQTGRLPSSEYLNGKPASMVAQVFERMVADGEPRTAGTVSEALVISSGGDATAVRQNYNGWLRARAKQGSYEAATAFSEAPVVTMPHAPSRVATSPAAAVATATTAADMGDSVYIKQANGKWKSVPVDSPEVDTATDVRLIPSSGRKAPVVSRGPLETTAGMSHQQVYETYGPILTRNYGYSSKQVQDMSEQELRWAVENMAQKKPVSARLAGMDAGQTLPEAPGQVPGGYGATPFEGSPTGPGSLPEQPWNPDWQGIDTAKTRRFPAPVRPARPEVNPLGDEFGYGNQPNQYGRWGTGEPTEGFLNLPNEPTVPYTPTELHPTDEFGYGNAPRPGETPAMVPPEGVPPVTPTEAATPQAVKKAVRARKPAVSPVEAAPEAYMPSGEMFPLSPNRRQIYMEIGKSKYGLSDEALAKFSDDELSAMAKGGAEMQVTPATPKPSRSIYGKSRIKVSSAGEQTASTVEEVKQAVAQAQERVQNPAPSDVWQPPALGREAFWGKAAENHVYVAGGEPYLRMKVKGGGKLIPDGTDHLWAEGGMWQRAGDDAYYIMPIDRNLKNPDGSPGHLSLTPGGMRKKSADIQNDVQALLEGRPHDAMGIEHSSADYEWWRQKGNQPVDPKLAYPSVPDEGEPVKIGSNDQLGKVFAPLGIKPDEKPVAGVFDSLNERYQLPRPQDRRIFQHKLNSDTYEFSYKSPVEGQKDLKLYAQKKGNVYVVTFADGKAAAPAPFKTLEDAATEARSLMEHGVGVGGEGTIVKGPTDRRFPVGFEQGTAPERRYAREYLRGMSPSEMLNETFPNPAAMGDPNAPENRRTVRTLLRMSGVPDEMVQSWVATKNRGAMIDAIEHSLGMRGMPGSPLDRDPFFFGAVLPIPPEVLAFFQDGYQTGVQRLAREIMGGISYSQKTGPVRGISIPDLALHSISGLHEMQQTLTDPVTLQRILGGMDSGLDNNARRGIMALLGDIGGMHDDVHAAAFASAENDVNWAMLDFTKSRKIDHALGIYGPWSFFQTRMPGRSFVAAMQRPDLVGRYYKTIQAIQRENEQSNVPDSMRGTVPIPGSRGVREMLGMPPGEERIGMSRLVLEGYPGALWYTANSYLNDRDPDNTGDALMSALDAMSVGMGPLEHTALDAALHGGTPKEPLSVGSMVPWWQMNYYHQMAQSGQIEQAPQPGGFANMQSGNRYDEGRIGRNINANQNVGTDTEAYARAQVAYQASGQEPPPGSIPPEAQALATQATQQTGAERFWHAVSSYSFSPVTVYSDAEKQSREQYAQRRSLYYDQGANPAGGRKAVEQFDIATRNEGRDFMSYVGAYDQEQDPKSALAQAQYNDLGYRKMAIENKYAALKQNWIDEHPAALRQEYNDYLYDTLIPRQDAEIAKAEKELPLGASYSDAGGFAGIKPEDRYAAENPPELQNAAMGEAIRQAESDLAAKGISKPVQSENPTFEEGRIYKQQKAGYEKQVDAAAMQYLQDPGWVQTRLGGRNPQTGKIEAGNAGTAVQEQGAGVSAGVRPGLGTGQAKMDASTYPSGLGSPHFGPWFPATVGTGQESSMYTPDPNNPYAEKMAEQEKLYGLPTGILQAIAQRESGYDPNADSGAAHGLMQFTPNTWNSVASALNLTDSSDPEQSIEAAAYYLDQINKGLPEDKKNDPGWMAAAYNDGPAAVADMTTLQDILNLPYKDKEARLAYAQGIQQEVGGQATTASLVAGQVPQPGSPYANPNWGKQEGNWTVVGTPITDTGKTWVSPVPAGTEVYQYYGAQDVDNLKDYYARVNKGFGHEGIDWMLPEGTHINSVSDGEVVFAGDGKDAGRPAYGNLIIVDHGDGYKSLYGHLSGFGVEVGDTVTAGQYIGDVGHTPTTAHIGDHLHLAVEHAGENSGPWDTIDPFRLIGQGGGQAAPTQLAQTTSYGPVPGGPLGQQARRPGGDVTLPPVAQVASATQPTQGAYDLDAYRKSVQEGYRTPAEKAQTARFDATDQASMDYVTKLYPQYANEFGEYQAIILQDKRAAYSAAHPEVKAVNLAYHNPAQVQEVESMFGSGATLRYARIPASEQQGGQPGARDAYYRQDPTSMLTKSWIDGRPTIRGDIDYEREIAPKNWGADYQEAQDKFGNHIWDVVTDYYRLPGGPSKEAKTARAKWYDDNPVYSAWSDWWYAGLPDNQVQPASFGYSGGNFSTRGGPSAFHGSNVNIQPTSLETIRANAITLARARRSGVDQGGWRKWLNSGKV